jgi:hypothetical protein
MPNIMPGFGFITGLFSCYNRRVLDPVAKSRTYTFDAEIPIGDDQSGQLQCVKGLLHFFVPQNEKKPEDDRKFFVSGKIISIHSTDEYSADEYDLEVEGLTVSKLLLLAVSIMGR